MNMSNIHSICCLGDVTLKSISQPITSINQLINQSINHSIVLACVYIEKVKECKFVCRGWKINKMEVANFVFAVALPLFFDWIPFSYGPEKVLDSCF